MIVMGGLVANTIYDATGARVLQLPMTAERVKAALPRNRELSNDNVAAPA